MIKKIGAYLVVGALACGIFLAAGCETTKGVATGLAVTAGGTGKGIVKDSKNAWQVLKKTDTWIQDNLW